MVLSILTFYRDPSAMFEEYILLSVLCAVPLANIHCSLEFVEARDQLKLKFRFRWAGLNLDCLVGNLVRNKILLRRNPPPSVGRSLDILRKGALSDSLKGVVSKNFSGGSAPGPPFTSRSALTVRTSHFGLDPPLRYISPSNLRSLLLL